MYRLNPDKELTVERINAYIADFSSWKLPLFIKYQNYYNGMHSILSRTMSDENKPNNKIVHPYCTYISNTMSSYFMGNNVTYTGKDDSITSSLIDIFKYNDEPSENLELATLSSIYGVSYELVYIDKQGEIRFKKLDPKECIPIYDDTLENELLYLIRFYQDKDILDATENTVVEVYSRQSIKTYKGIAGMYTLVDEQLHGFTNIVPISVYKNNEDETNDFGKVISLVDAYDRVVSDSVNDMDQFADSYLVLNGVGQIDEDTLNAMKENRILLLDDNSTAQWLVKNVNDTYSQNIENRLNDDIYKFSSCLDLTSDISAVSGIAIKYRLISMENAASSKEVQFKKGLLRRIELINTITRALGSDIFNVNIKFNRNLPTDETEAATLVNSLNGIVSEQTLLGLLPFIDDPQEEMKKREQENDIYGDLSEDNSETNQSTGTENLQ